MIKKRRGHYLGTEVDGKWWSRYRKDGFFARGLGKYWIENSFLYFLRHLQLLNCKNDATSEFEPRLAGAGASRGWAAF